jgi:zinc transport system substrate-binding protein
MIVMKMPRRRLAAAALATPLLLAGCGDPLTGGDSGTRVVTSFYPLEYVAQRIVGEHADVVTLTSPGVEPHDLELTVRQTAEVSEADLVVYEKGLQPAVDAAVAEHGPEQVVEATDVVALAEGDLHFWLDPVRLAEVAAEVEARVAEIDPDNAADYEANLATLRADLESVDTEYTDGLAECKLDTVVVSHDAFGYLEQYGLHFKPIAGLSPDAEPSPKHLTELAELIESEGITTVFSETLASPAMAETLASDLGLDTAVLDPIEGLSDATAGEDYLSLMRANLVALQEANGCR